jgi:DNA-binding NarL/FixJ family response regulator
VTNPLPTPAAKIRVLLVDDHPGFRTALRHVLEACADIDVVAEAADGLAALRLAGESAPDIVCVDNRLPALSGGDTIRRLRLEHPALPVIGLSACDEHATMAGMLAAGAVAYVSKQDAGDALAPLIRRWHRRA